MGIMRENQLPCTSFLHAWLLNLMPQREQNCEIEL